MYIDDELYKKIIETTVIQTVDVIFLSPKNKILLWFRENEPLKWVYYILWWRRLKWEPMLISAVRKMKDEIGIEIDPKKLVFLWVYDDIMSNSRYDWVSTHCSPITYVYKFDRNEMNDLENNLKLDKQHEDLKFFDLNDESLHDMVKERIVDMKNLWII